MNIYSWAGLWALLWEINTGQVSAWNHASCCLGIWFFKQPAGWVLRLHLRHRETEGPDLWFWVCLCPSLKWLGWTRCSLRGCPHLITPRWYVCDSGVQSLCWSAWWTLAEQCWWASCMAWRHDFGPKQIWLGALAQLFFSCLALDKSLYLAGSQFPSYP